MEERVMAEKITKEVLAVIMADLSKVIKQEKSPEYRSGYVDGILDFYNETTNKLKES